MKITANPLKDSLSSCILEIKSTKVMCAICIQQKTELEPSTVVEFVPQMASKTFEALTSLVENVFIKLNNVTQIKVNFYEIINGCYDAYANAFSVAVLLSGLPISDTISASSISKGNVIFSLCYNLHRKEVCQFYFEGLATVSEVREAIMELVDQCEKNGADIKKQVASIAMS